MAEPITAIAAALSAFNTLKEWAHELQTRTKDENNLQYEKLALRIENKVLELERDIQKLAQENETLRQKADLRDKLEFRDGLYYLTEKVPGLSEGPFCPICWENRETPITLGGSYLYCHICQLKFRPPPRRQFKATTF